MIDELVKSIISKMKTEYPQLEVPGAMRAVIVRKRAVNGISGQSI